MNVYRFIKVLLDKAREVYGAGVHCMVFYGPAGVQPLHKTHTQSTSGTFHHMIQSLLGAVHRENEYAHVTDRQAYHEYVLCAHKRQNELKHTRINDAMQCTCTAMSSSTNATATIIN